MDPRIFAVRRDLADARLADRVFAPHYAIAHPCGVIAAAPLFAEPRADGDPLSEVLAGERFDLLEKGGDRAWGIAADGAVGYIPLAALGPAEPAAATEAAADPVAVAEGLVGTPLKPGGRSPAGVDAAGLIYVALTAAGRPCPRFLDMQATLGSEIAVDAADRGDVILFADHSGLMADAATLIHATAAGVVREPLAVVIAAGRHGAVTGARRP